MNLQISKLAFLAIAIFTPAQATVAQESVDFYRQVKPILSDKCFACHGPDESTRASELRLDQRESAIQDLGGYQAIVPGDAENSELIRRIFSDDPDEVMPPTDHLKKLLDSEKRILKLWIEEDAKWAEHWSFIKPVKSEIPDVDLPIGNFIDAFVFDELAEQEIALSGKAEKHTLLRRLSFDLTGLPPAISDLANFDTAGKGYDATVDRLLESPHFGERLAVYWLDLVRYADSVGYHGDQPVSVTPYRDYVINAFNENMPFDQFTREQLAGDLLENPTQAQLIASGYNRLGMMSAEGGVQPEEYLAKYASDRVRTTASVWLGVTLGCAECHDHKFDPFSTKEFYQFASFFADIKEKGLYSGANNTGEWGLN